MRDGAMVITAPPVGYDKNYPLWLEWRQNWPDVLRPVYPKSSIRTRRAAELLACYFRREFNYDFVQYNHDEETDDRDRVWLWVDSRSTIEPIAVGVCCFRWREQMGNYGLAFVWLHPYRRRTGLLRHAWPLFRQHYGSFITEPPLSPAMHGFLSSVGECWCSSAGLCVDPSH